MQWRTLLSSIALALVATHFATAQELPVLPPGVARQSPPPAESPSPGSGAPTAKPSSSLSTERETIIAQRDALWKESQALINDRKLDAAVPKLESVIALQRKLFGDTDAQVTDGLTFLANVHSARRDFAARRKVTSEILVAKEKTLGKDHWQVVEVRVSMADCDILARLTEAQRNDWTKVEQLLKEAQGLWTKKPTEAAAMAGQAAQLAANTAGREHWLTAAALRWQGMILLMARQDRQAVAPLTQALAIQEKVFGAMHPGTALCLGKLGEAHLGAGNPAAALQPLQRALEVNERLLGDHPETGDNLQNLSACTAALGDSAASKSYIERAVTLREKILGPDHPHTLLSQDGLANAYADLGDHAKAIQIYQRVLAQREKILGPENPQTTMTMAGMARSYREQNNFTAALPLLQRALAIHEKARLVTPDTARILETLGDLYQAQEKPAVALPFLQRALQINSNSLGPEHPNAINNLFSIARCYQLQGNVKAALPEFQRILKIQEKQLGADHPSTAATATALALAYRDFGDIASALALQQRALKSYEKSYGAEHLQTAISLTHLADVYHLMGDYGSAVTHYQRALKITEKTFGPDHYMVGSILSGLGSLYRQRGDFAAALPLVERSLVITEKSYGPEHPFTAAAVDNLSAVYFDQKDYTTALPLMQRAVKIREKQGAEHPSLSKALINLGTVHRNMGDNATALTLFQRAHAINQKNWGAGHPDTATSAAKLGTIYAALRDVPNAKRLYEQALSTRERMLGANHFETAIAVNNLANLYYDQGDFAAALPLFQRAAKIREQALGPDHFETAGSLQMVAFSQLRLGKPQEALPIARRALDIQRKHLDATAAIQSESQQLVLQQSHREFLDGYLSAAVEANADPAALYEQLLAWKGAVLLRQRWIRAARQALAADPEVGQLFAKLEEKSRQLSAGVRTTPALDKAAAQREVTSRLVDEVDALQRQLAGASREFRKAREATRSSPADVQKLLPKGTVLVDFINYRQPIPRPPGFQARLAAFVVRPDRKIARVDLGPSEEIALAIEAWRITRLPNEMFAHDANTVTKIWEAWRTGFPSASPERKLREWVWEKLEPHLDGSDTVLVSPDGMTSRFPWGALPGKQPGRYVLEEVAIAQIPVPQRLSEIVNSNDAANKAPASLLVIGDVNFNADPGRPEQPHQAHVALRPVDAPAIGPELPGSKAEMLAIEQLFRRALPAGKAQQLRGAAATEQAVRSYAPQATFVHLATHGYFGRPPQTARAASADNNPWETFGVLNQQAASVQSDFLGGVCLAGARQPLAAGRDDGVLTAFEVKNLNLEQVELVTLSACQTGLGVQVNSEGVLGLQRALEVAGARSTVSTLWNVHDQATQALMTDFYENLWIKKLPAQALRQAQLKMLREGAKHLAGVRPEDADKPLPPYFWAAFVLAGDWR